MSDVIHPIEMLAKDLLCGVVANRAKHYVLAEHRRCHVCSKEYSRLAAAALEGCVMQSATGRLFCSNGCWSEYLRREGL